MHYLTHSITKMCQGRKQRYEGCEGIPVYDCSRKEGVYGPRADKRDLTAKSENLPVMHILKILSIQSHS